MKHDALFKQWVTPVASAVIGLMMASAATNALAMGLGSIHVNSSLGEVLSADVDVMALTPTEADSLHVALANADAYQAAGLEMSSALMGASVTLEHRPDGQPYLRIRGSQPVNDPFIDLLIQTDNNETGKATRGYTVLIDPPSGVSKPVKVNPPVLAPVVSRVKPQPAESLAPQPEASTESNASSSSSANQGAVKQTPRAANGQDVRVQKGDTAGALARRMAGEQGVSFDQMLAALLRSNPDAFIHGNVNRLKAGVVLQTPSAEDAQSVNSKEAKRQWMASGNNFKAYRRSLAKMGSAQVGEQAGRSASGNVESAVTDQNSDSAPHDKLTLGKARSHKNREEQALRKRHHAESSARVAELSKNIEDLKNLSKNADKGASKGATGNALGTGKAAAAGAAVAVASPLLTATSKPAASHATATPEPTKTSTPTLAPTIAPTSAASPVLAASAAASMASAAQVAASAAAPVASQAVEAASQASAMVSASAAGQEASAAVAAVKAMPKISTPKTEGGLMERLGEYTMPIAGALGALVLGGLGFALYRRRKPKAGQVDSAAFLESKLEADSFFDASGGQRVDTASRPGGISSSMVYSPSQLDAAGDVDPVAEAGVYMAYNRDQQAEDILKEAMRITPSRVAIYTTLMEIYAKRGDLKAFDVVAKEAYHLTNGQGEEWAKAALLGKELEPSNPMYGGKDGASTASEHDEEAAAPVAVSRPAAAPTEPMSLEHAQAAAKLEDADLDMVFRNSDFRPSTSGESHEETAVQHLHTTPIQISKSAEVPAAPAASTMNMDFLDFDMSAPVPVHADPAAAAPHAADAQFTEEGLSGHAPAAGHEPLKFDMSDLSLDLSAPAPVAAAASAAVHAGGTPAADDPWMTKLELAKEFVSLGDTDGARAMAEEVIAHAPAAVADQARTFVAGLV